MRLVINVNMENDAFQPDWEYEVSRILKEIAENPREKSIMDINGNKVGSVKIED